MVISLSPASGGVIDFYVVEVSLEPTAAFGQIEGLKKGTRETDQATG